MKNLRNKNHPPNADIVAEYLESSWDTVVAIYNNLDLLVELGTALENGELDQYLTEADIDTQAKINGILTDIQLGRFSTQAEAESGTNNDTTMTPLRVAQAIAALAIPYDNNLTGDGPPTVTDDGTQGYGVNSIWIDITADPDETYRCTDASTGAAIWIKTSLTADELATVAISGDSDDLIQGSVQLLMTVAERTKLGNVPETGAEIAALLFAEADTNNFDDAYKGKLDNIEANATADQTDAEIVTGYNNLVAQVSEGERTAGTEATVRRFSPADVADMADKHSAGLSPALANADFTAASGKKYFCDSTVAPINVNLPAGTPLANIGFADVVHYAGTNNIIVTPFVGDTIDGQATYTMDQDEDEIELVYDSANSNWQVANTGVPDLVNVSEFVYKYRGRKEITGAYTLQKADEGYLLIANSASDFNLTIPANGTTAFDEGTFFNLLNKGVGTVTVIIDTDTLITGDNECEQFKGISIIQDIATEWWVVGGITSV